MKPEYYYYQSAVIPYRKNKKEKFDILLIKSRSGKHWIVPKGIIEPDMSAHKSAEKEAREEAGILGKASDKLLGEYQYKKWGGTCSVKVFKMKVETELDTWEEDFRIRKWFPIKKAIELLENEELAKIFRSLK